MRNNLLVVGPATKTAGILTVSLIGSNSRLLKAPKSRLADMKCTVLFISFIQLPELEEDFT